MESTILEFIKVFRSPETEELFTNCACFWFASILLLRFPKSEIMYNPETVHFATKIKGNLYDITGKLEDTEGYVAWHHYNGDDFEEVHKDCILIV